MLGWFVETTLVASGLAVVAALASRLRSIGPTARHVLWLVVLVKLMTPPLVSWPWAAHWGDLNWPLALAAGRRSPLVATTIRSCRRQPWLASRSTLADFDRTTASTVADRRPIAPREKRVVTIQSKPIPPPGRRPGASGRGREAG